MPDGNLKIVIDGDASKAVNAIRSIATESASTAGAVNTSSTAFAAGMKKIEVAAGGPAGSIIELKQIIKSLEGEIENFDTQAGSTKGLQALSVEYNLAKLELKALQEQVGLTKFSSISQDATKSTAAIKSLSVETAVFSKTLKDVGAQSDNGFSTVIKGANNAFGSIRKIAYILPGIGIAGIFAFAGEAILAGVQKLGLFDRATLQSIDDNKEFVKTLDEVSKSIGSQAGKITTLVNGLNSGTLDTAQRKKALTELKQQNEEYFGSLKDEKGNIVGLTAAYDAYIANLLKIGQAKAIESEITKLFDKKLQLQLEIDPKFIATTSSTVQEQIGRLKKDLDKLGGPVVIDEKQKDVFSAGNESLRKRIDIQQKINDLEQGGGVFLSKSILDTKKQISDIDLRLQGLSQLQKTVGEFQIQGDHTKTKPTTDKDISAIKAQIAALEQLQKQGDITRVELEQLFNLKIKLINIELPKTKLTADQAGRLITDLQNQADAALASKPFDLRIKIGNIITGLSANATQGDVNEALKKVFDATAATKSFPLKANVDLQIPTGASQKVLEQLKKDIGGILPVRVTPIVDITDVNEKLNAISKIPTFQNFLDKAIKTDGLEKGLDEALALFKDFQTKLKNIAGSLKNLVTDSITGLSESIGQAFAGGKNPFAGFINIIADGLESIGKQMILAAPIIAALKIALKSLNPAILLPAGIALVAIGAALKTKVSQTAFAEGGIVTGPTNALIGERGPEVVFPLNQLKKFIPAIAGNGINDPIVLGTLLKGDDIWISQQRTGRRKDRV